MNNAKEFWFWLKLVICPILILNGVYVVGKLVGGLMVSQSGLPTIDSALLVPLAGAVCAMYVLYYTGKEAITRFAGKPN